MREFRTVAVADNRAECVSNGRATTRDLPLLAAKMAPPEMGDVVARPRLSGRVDAEGRPVTLVAAPAGWGKTVLLGSWFRERRPGEQLAWLTVEPGDRSDHLWSYLEAVLPVADGTAAAATSGEPLMHLAAALARLPSPVTLVVDGADHVDDPSVTAGLDYLVGHADGRLRLVLGVRTPHHLPLHRWRLRAAVTELSDDDLAFTTAEAAEMLALHGVALPRCQVEQLRERIEGWAVGLRLAAILLPGQPEPARFVDEFGGDLAPVADYLTDEVVNTLSPGTIEAFTRAAIDEQLCGGLLDALTGGTGGAELLSDAAARTGFVLRLNARPGAFRHRRVFRDLFRARLRRRPEPEVRELHRRAARWYAEHDQPSRALRHALVGRDRDAAERLLATSWRELLPPAAHPAAPAAPPPPPADVRGRPALALAHAADQLAAHDLPAADHHLRLAGAAEPVGPGASPYPALLGAALRLAGAELAGDRARIRAAAGELLVLAEPPDAPASPPDIGARAIARVAVGRILMAVGHLAAAEAELSAGLVDAEATGLVRAGVAAASRLAAVQALQGRLDAAERSGQLALARPAQDPPVDRSPAHVALALVALHRDQPAEVEAQLALAEARCDAVTAAIRDLTAARLRLDQGDLGGSHDLLQAARQQAAVAGRPGYVMGLLAAADADLHIAHGDLETARGTLVEAIEAGAEPAGPLAVSLARAHLRSGDPHPVAPLLAAGSDRDDDSWPRPARLAAGLLDAQAARLLGDGRRSAFLLERVLALAEAERYRHVFTHADPTARDLLAAHLDTGTAHWPLVSDLLAESAVAPAPGAAPAPYEPLTEREMTVLRYLQSILSNVEIANELSVSVNTVKTHVRSIYRKLDATRRRDAVRRARDLHLL